MVFWDLLLAFWQYYALRLNLINVIFNWRLLIFNGETWILSLLHMCVETLNFSYVHFGFAHSKCQILNSLINISWNCFKFFNMRNLKLIFQRHRNGWPQDGNSVFKNISSTNFLPIICLEWKNSTTIICVICKSSCIEKTTTM